MSRMQSVLFIEGKGVMVDGGISRGIMEFQTAYIPLFQHVVTTIRCLYNSIALANGGPGKVGSIGLFHF